MNTNKVDQSCPEFSGSQSSGVHQKIAVALMTGGSDRPYVYGLVNSLISQRATLDLIGSDELDFPEFHALPGLNFLNFRGSSRTDAKLTNKVCRILLYYFRLIRYAATARPRIFHILWNNKFEVFDRTLLMLYYKLLGKKITLTVHNVNAARRDAKDTWLNRFTLRAQYRLSDQAFVHTDSMKRELIEEFGVPASRITVIPFGINNAVPNTSLTPEDAKRRLNLRREDRAILFFGRITPYKGLEFLIDAVRQVRTRCADYRLIIAGRPDRCEEYWSALREQIRGEVERGEILLRDEFIPDEETEVFFKAADVLALPYRNIYQSGVLFLGLSFGLPILAADVGSFNEEIQENRTGFMFRSEDAADLASSIERYFASSLYAGLNSRRPEIRKLAAERHSWEVVSQITTKVYAGLLRSKLSVPDSSGASLNKNAPVSRSSDHAEPTARQ
jgi:glycosyltransferase involved in cell wall biosynthesis